MDDFPIYDIHTTEEFPQLAHIPDPPRILHMRGSLERTIGTKFVTIVGSRNYTSYGKHVCESLIKGLAGYPITIVSGLALGIDSIAHRAALDAGIPTIAFPGSGLDWKVLYPASHRGLAGEILEAGGALLSEFPHTTRGAQWTFPRRNRLEAGISDITIIIEAEEKSGTLITARLGTEYNKIVGAVPGPITSSSSKGANWLLRLGAVPITNTTDILQELGLAEKLTSDVSEYLSLNAEEEQILAALSEPKSKEQLLDELSLDPVSANITFSMLEIKGVIRETLGLLERIM
jgi:DNA processing protein